MIDQRLARWLVSNDVGSSSKTIAMWLGAKVKSDCWTGISTPSDPGDLGRCLRLLALFPEWEGRIHEMSEVGGAWPTFVAHWGKMAASMAEEVGVDWSKGKEAPRTYALMKRVETLASAARTDGVKSVTLGRGATVSFRS